MLSPYSSLLLQADALLASLAARLRSVTGRGPLAAVRPSRVRQPQEVAVSLMTHISASSSALAAATGFAAAVAARRRRLLPLASPRPPAYRPLVAHHRPTGHRTQQAQARARAASAAAAAAGAAAERWGSASRRPMRRSTCWCHRTARRTSLPQGTMNTKRLAPAAPACTLPCCHRRALAVLAAAIGWLHPNP